MWESPLFQIGAGGAFGLLALREVLRFARWMVERRNGVLVRSGNPGPAAAVAPDGWDDIRLQVAKLYDWHDDREPRTGVFRWKMLPTLYEDLKTAIDGLSTTMREMDGNEGGRHGRLRESITSLEVAIVANTATVDTVGQKLDRYFEEFGERMRVGDAADQSRGSD